MIELKKIQVDEDVDASVIKSLRQVAPDAVLESVLTLEEAT